MVISCGIKIYKNKVVRSKETYVCIDCKDWTHGLGLDINHGEDLESSVN